VWWRDLDPISAELTITAWSGCALSCKMLDSIFDIVWARDPETGREVKYGDVRLADEQAFSVYNFEVRMCRALGGSSSLLRLNVAPHRRVLDGDAKAMRLFASAFKGLVGRERSVNRRDSPFSAGLERTLFTLFSCYCCVISMPGDSHGSATHARACVRRRSGHRNRSPRNRRIKSAGLPQIQ